MLSDFGNKNLDVLIKTPTPLQRIHSELWDQQNIQLWIKRDDLTHPHVQGNKWRKLQHNLFEAKRLGKKYLLTFGGAYSNHLYATAAAGHLFGFKTIGIVRGGKITPLNATLSFAKKNEMQLFFVDRQSYRLKEKLLPQLDIPLEDCYVLPEGGTNELALKGCMELAKEIFEQVETPSDYICLSCGTGGTAAGIISNQNQNQNTHVLAFSALKGDFLKNEIQLLLDDFSPTKNHNYSIQTDYHFGGYAKHNAPLLEFINDFKNQFDIQLEPIYTGKMFYGIFDLLKKRFFKSGSRIVAIHTGGLQGLNGFRERFGDVI